MIKELKNLTEKQDKELDEILTSPKTDLCFLSGDNKRKITKLIAKIRKETAEMVCDRMIGNFCSRTPRAGFSDGYNMRIEEEEIHKKQILYEILTLSH